MLSTLIDVFCVPFLEGVLLVSLENNTFIRTASYPPLPPPPPPRSGLRHCYHPRQRLRLLGIYLDNSLSVASQVAMIKSRMHACACVLKRLSGATWGPKITLLRTLATSYAQSRVLYGLCAVYGLASEAMRKQLDALDARLGRAVIGAPHGTRSLATTLEAGLIPIRQLTMERSLRLLLSLQSAVLQLQHRCLELLPASFARTGCGWHALGCEAKQALDQAYGDSRLLLPVRLLPGHWRLLYHNRHDRLHHGQLRRRHAFEMCLLSCLRPDSYIVFSDGSIKNGRGGAGAVVRSPRNVWHSAFEFVGLDCSSTTAELMSIKIGLSLLQEHYASCSHIILCSDSHSSLDLLAGHRLHGPPLLDDVYVLLHAPIARRLDLVKTPAHVGLSANEQADQLAAAATQLALLLSNLCSLGPVCVAVFAFLGEGGLILLTTSTSSTTTSTRGDHNTFQLVLQSRAASAPFGLRLRQGTFKD